MVALTSARNCLAVAHSGIYNNCHLFGNGKAGTPNFAGNWIAAFKVPAALESDLTIPSLSSPDVCPGLNGDIHSEGSNAYAIHCGKALKFWPAVRLKVIKGKNLQECIQECDSLPSVYSHPFSWLFRRVKTF